MTTITSSRRQNLAAAAQALAEAAAIARQLRAVELKLAQALVRIRACHDSEIAADAMQKILTLLQTEGTA